jgi:hypothetical protein
MTGHQSTGLRHQGGEVVRPESRRPATRELVALGLLGGAVAVVVGGAVGLLVPVGAARTALWVCVAAVVALLFGFWTGHRMVRTDRRTWAPGPPPGGPR